MSGLSRGVGRQTDGRGRLGFSLSENVFYVFVGDLLTLIIFSSVHGFCVCVRVLDGLELELQP